MFAINPDLLLFLLLFPVSDCDRRIKDGEEVSTEKRYVVYLVKASISPRHYDTWLCGGALVSREFIITSAACVEDVEFLYAIAGYKKYVTDGNLETDPCTKEKKKKVIYTCTPVSYEFKYDQLSKWAYIDIALVKVESPYDFNDATYQVVCSYIPASIPINYEVKYQEPGTDAMVFGWGHKFRWRRPEDTKNYNQEVLNYASTLLEDKETCKKHYEVYPHMTEVIDQYMICTLVQGNINDAGETILKSPPTAEGCTTNQQKLMGFEGISCEEGEGGDEDMLMDNTRREGAKINQTYSNSSRIKKPVNSTKMINETLEQSRRSGICQNDHGGPLVTWVGSHEVLIGVASVFKVSEDSQCMGPYLYTSTQCNGAFLDCVLTSKDLPDPVHTQRRNGGRSLCDSDPSEKGYDTVERHISWMYHPSGPSDNERKAANLHYGSGKQDRYAQDRDKFENDYDGNDRHKNYERHAPDKYGADHYGKDKYGVDKHAPVKYGSKNEADKYEAEKYGDPNYEYDSGGAKGGERYKSGQSAGNDRYRSEPNPKNEQPPTERYKPEEKFVMRPQLPLRN